MLRLIKYAAVFSILLTLTPAALARDSVSDGANGAVTTAIAVPYGDLDLTGQAGIKTLLKRVKAASETVCGASAPTLNQGLARNNARCRYIAASEGLRQLNQPEIMAAFEQSVGRAALYASR